MTNISKIHEILTTKRLLLEEAVVDDAEFFIELLNSPNWIRYIGDRGIKTKEGAIRYIEKSLITSYKKNGYGLYKMSLKDSKTPIGICGFVKRDYLEHADIGFAILPKFEGYGFTNEAALATMHYGKSQLNMTKILAITNEENTKSCKLLSKIGLLALGKIIPPDGNKEFLLFSD